MLAYNLTERDAKQAAAKVGVEIREWRNSNGRSVRFRLGLKGDRRWGRISASAFSGRRKVAAVCWHGHREFFRELFKLSPQTRIQTAQTRQNPRGERYYTAENFEEVFPQTDRNIGAPIAPMHYSEACEHDERGRQWKS